MVNVKVGIKADTSICRHESLWYSSYKKINIENFYSHFHRSSLVLWRLYTNIIRYVGIPFLPSTSNKVYFFIAFRECILFTKGFRLNALQENKGIYKYLVAHLNAILNLPYFIINDEFYQNYIR